MAITTVTIHKQANGIGSDGEWENTYTVEGPEDLYTDDWTQMVNGIVTAEKGWHCNFVNFQRAIVRYKAKGATKANPLHARAIPLAGIGAIGAYPGAGAGAVHVAPPETCLVGLLSGGGVRFSRMLYRCALGTDVWINNGHGVELTDAFKLQVTNDLVAMINGINGRAGFSLLIGGTNANAGRKVIGGSCGGVENRQLTQQRTGKKGLDITNSKDLLELIERATVIAAEVSTVVANRYSPVPGAALALPAAKAALRALASAADSAKGALDTNDYGDHPALPPAP